MTPEQFAMKDWPEPPEPLDPLNLGSAIHEVVAELTQAKENWPRWPSAHHGFAIINEEFDELKKHVWTKQTDRDLIAMRKEAMQVAAMAIRFMIEVCDEKTGRS